MAVRTLTPAERAKLMADGRYKIMGTGEIIDFVADHVKNVLVDRNSRGDDNGKVGDV